MSFPRRGEIYWVSLDPTVGTEIAKTRRALVISNDIGNQHADRVIVAPLTSGGIDRTYPFEVLIGAGEAACLALRRWSWTRSEPSTSRVLVPG